MGNGDEVAGEPQKTEVTGFTPAQALAIFKPCVLDSKLIREWVHGMLHPEPVPICPECGQVVESHQSRVTFSAGRRICCYHCRRFFNSRTKTILHGSPITDEQLFMIAALSEFSRLAGADDKLSRRYIAEITGLSIDSVKKWQDALRLLETPLV